MNTETKHNLIVLGIVGVMVGIWWYQRKSSFSNARGRQIGGTSRGEGGRTESGWGHPSFIKVCEDAGGTYSGDAQGNGLCSGLPPSAPNPLPRPIFKQSTQSTM